MSFTDLLTMGDRAILTLEGDPVTYTPGIGSPVSVTGIFDSLYQFVDEGNAGVMSTAPAVFLRLSDLPSDPTTDLAATVTINTVHYQFREVLPDGKGGVRLRLHVTA